MIDEEALGLEMNVKHLLSRTKPPGLWGGITGAHQHPPAPPVRPRPVLCHPLLSNPTPAAARHFTKGKPCLKQIVFSGGQN